MYANNKWKDGYSASDGWDPASRDRYEGERGQADFGISVWDIIKMGFWVMIVAGALSLLCGCKPVERVVDRERIDTLVVYRHDSLVQTKVYVDSVYVRDSMWMENRGETIYVWKERVKSMWRERVDTLRLVKTDTIYRSRMEKVEKVVEKPRSVWERMRSMCAWVVVVMVVVVGAMAYLKIKKLF